MRLLLLLGCCFATTLPPALEGVSIHEKLGAQVDGNLSFYNEQGKSVLLRDVITRPVILVLVYYECPHLCTFVLNGLIEGLKGVQEDVELVVISIDPREAAAVRAGSDLAQKKKDSYAVAYGRAHAGWHFFTGEERAVRKLADAIGFAYRYDEKDMQYAHGAGLFFLGPSGILKRFLPGVSFASRDIRLALAEAAGSGHSSSLVQQMQLFCYRYDPKARTYSVALMRLMRVAVLVTVGLVGTYLGLFWSGRRRKGSRWV